VCVHIIVHNCCTQHSTEQFWLSSLLSSRQASELRRCLLEGAVIVMTAMCAAEIKLLLRQKIKRLKRELSAIYSDISCLFIRISSTCDASLTCSESAVDHGLLRSVWIIPDGKDTIISPVIFSRQLESQQHNDMSQLHGNYMSVTDTARH